MPGSAVNFESACVECGRAVTVSMSAGEAELECTREALLRYACCDSCREMQRAAETKAQAAQIVEAIDPRRAESRIDQYFLPFDADHPQANHGLFRWMGDHRGESVLLASASGAGKSRILCHYGLEELKRGRVLYYRSADMMDELAAAFIRKEGYGKRLLWQLSTVDLLIIDDLSKEAISDTRIMRLWQIIDARYTAWEQEKLVRTGRGYRRDGRGWKTWVSTNWSANDLIERMGTQNGAPILRRMIDMMTIWKG